MKKKYIILLYILIFTIFAYYRNDIASFLVENVIYEKQQEKLDFNKYYKKENYEYIKNTENFKVENKVDIINVIFSILNSGANEFTFYCSENYNMCQYDIEEISINENLLSVLNNFVHPFNSYNKLYISSNNMGKIKLEINKLYTNDEITYINDQLTVIKQKILNSSMNDIDKIRAFHDYIIESTDYDKERAAQIADNNLDNNKFMSNKANGVLQNHIALCSGYTDLMAVFLNDLKIKNYKISTTEHIWNAVYINNNWYHLDMTWDDPLTVDQQSVLIHDYFLITDEELTNKKTNQHNYDLSIYKEIATVK